MIFASNLGAPETPRLLKDKSWLCVEMAPHRGGVTHISADGKDVTLVAKTGTPNGCIMDTNGDIWVAETHPHPSLMHTTMDGHVEVYLDTVAGKGFLLPNDLCFSADGTLYMTDSGMLMSEWVVNGGLRPDWATAPFDGRVYAIDLKTKTVAALDWGLRFPNGLAFGPDDHLYVNEMITGMVYRYPFKDGKPTGQREDFGNVLTEEWAGGFRGPDGMAFGSNGHLYCTVYGQQDLTVLDPVGRVVQRIKTQGSAPTNVAFGPDGEHRIYVTEHQLGQIEVFDVDTSGLPLHHVG
ncbi:MAG: SMP-30/gluconolactonase/LRE family protein [Anaerolineae bacterium]|nr:SMP-30/gluconolactonase/LRE family protein [Anaerolineae bacterium]